jgi:hypothetical protein
MRAACVTRGTEIHIFDWVFGAKIREYASSVKLRLDADLITINRGINSELCYVCALEETNLAQAEFKSFIEFHASARRHDEMMISSTGADTYTRNK